jgi:hypothetical protein
VRVSGAVGKSAARWESRAARQENWRREGATAGVPLQQGGSRGMEAARLGGRHLDPKTGALGQHSRRLDEKPGVSGRSGVDSATASSARGRPGRPGTVAEG